MNKYIILIKTLNKRNLNVIKMEELQSSLTKDGFSSVSYVHTSGNLVATSEMDQEEVKMWVEDLLYDDYDIDAKCRVIEFDVLNDYVDDELFVEYVGERVFVSLVDPKFKFEVDTVNDLENIRIIEVYENVVITCCLVENKTPNINFFLEEYSKGFCVTRSIKVIEDLFKL